jgi:hypothetical protein
LLQPDEIIVAAMNAATVATDGEWLRISFSGDGASQKAAAATPHLSAIAWNRDEKRKIAQPMF